MGITRSKTCTRGTAERNIEITTTLFSLLTRQSEFSQLLKIMMFKVRYERGADVEAPNKSS